jgi:hypothetical protein
MQPATFHYGSHGIDGTLVALAETETDPSVAKPLAGAVHPTVDLPRT